MRLYPPYIRKGQSFEDVKSVVVPNQSMTLAEIIRRFIRKESLPIEHEGIYEERMGDLEKIARMDLTERAEITEDLRAKVERARQILLKREEQEKQLAAPAPTPTPEPIAPPEGGSTQKSPPTGA